jgi:hypothetical protein
MINDVLLSLIMSFVVLVSLNCYLFQSKVDRESLTALESVLDRGETGFVNVYKFASFARYFCCLANGRTVFFFVGLLTNFQCRGFAPLLGSVARLKNLLEKMWYVDFAIDSLSIVS